VLSWPCTSSSNSEADKTSSSCVHDSLLRLETWRWVPLYPRLDIGRRVQSCAETMESKEGSEESLGKHSLSTCLIGNILRCYVAKKLSGWDVDLASLARMELSQHLQRCCPSGLLGIAGVPISWHIRPSFAQRFGGHDILRCLS
jgi:hypothetical protein